MWDEQIPTTEKGAVTKCDDPYPLQIFRYEATVSSGQTTDPTALLSAPFSKLLSIANESLQPSSVRPTKHQGGLRRDQGYDALCVARVAVVLANMPSCSSARAD